MKKRVFLDLERTRKKFSGLHNFCMNIFNFMVDKNFNVDILFYVDKSLAKKYKDNSNVIPFSRLHFIYNKWINKSDIIHIMWQLSSSVYAVRNLFNKKIIFTVHDLNVIYTKDEYKSVKRLKIIRTIAEKCDKITTVSDFTKSELIRHLGIDENKIVTIYNGVTLKEFPHFKTPKYKPESKFLFSIGEIRNKKNFHTLIPLLIDNNYTLILSGNKNVDKNYRDIIIQESKKYNVSDRVILTNTISDEEKYWYFKNCEAFLFPSLFEGFGIPPIEAMILGKPVFLSKWTSLPEIGGDVAYYFDNFEPEIMIKNFNEGMADFNKNKEIRQKQFIEHSKKFSIENSISKYLKLYESFC